MYRKINDFLHIITVVIVKILLVIPLIISTVLIGRKALAGILIEPLYKWMRSTDTRSTIHDGFYEDEILIVQIVTTEELRQHHRELMDKMMEDYNEPE